MHDGDIDYSKYTLLELEEALAGINRHQYPKNYANLRYAYEQLAATISQAPPPERPSTASDIAASETHTSAWKRFWDSRPITGLLGVFCLWWANDFFTQPSSCPSDRKLAGAILKAICENFGHEVAASIPFVLGLILIVYAAIPRRQAGA